MGYRLKCKGKNYKTSEENMFQNLCKPEFKDQLLNIHIIPKE